MADITFTDGDGKTITLDGSLRISDLVERGIIGPRGFAELRISLPEPPQSGVYVADQPPRFPVMLRKMWSGGEVQAWIDKNWRSK